MKINSKNNVDLMELAFSDMAKAKREYYSRLLLSSEEVSDAFLSTKQIVQNL